MQDILKFQTPTGERTFRRGKHVPKEDLKVGGVYFCGDDDYDSTSCWIVGEEYVPFIIDEIDSDGDDDVVAMHSVCGDEQRCCSCDDLHHLYEVEEITDANTPPSVLVNGVEYVPKEALDVITINGVKYKRMT